MTEPLDHPVFNRLHGKKVVLASNSPRRQDILSSLGLKYDIVPSTFAEDLPKDQYKDRPYEYAIDTATEKAMDVYQRLAEQSLEEPPDLVIGADTIVVNTKNEILGKPATPSTAFSMLKGLNGPTSHRVYTALTLIYPKMIPVAPGYEVRSLVEVTTVEFAENSDELIRSYVKSGEGLDKAGGYAIQGQGKLLVKRIEGDYFNVVGFPASSFVNLISQLIANEEFI